MGAVLFILNSLIILLIKLNSLGELSYKIDLVKTNLPKRDEVIFYKKENPLFIFYLEKPAPVVKEKEEVFKYLKNGYGVFTFEEIKNLKPILIIQDPYKKERIWYYYKLSS